MYRVIPPTGLALPDVVETPDEAHNFFRLHYFDRDPDHLVTWYWLEKIRPMRYSDFVVPTMLSGSMKERMAELGIDDSHLPEELGAEFESVAKQTIDYYAKAHGLDVPGWIVEERSRVDCQ